MSRDRLRELILLLAIGSAVVAERAPYSITSSAIASTPRGIVQPGALAGLRLITTSNLIGCRIGKSAGFVAESYRQSRRNAGTDPASLCRRTLNLPLRRIPGNRISLVTAPSGRAGAAL